MSMLTTTLGLDWTWGARQWIAFAGVALCGAGAIGLLSYAVHVVRGWTAPALYRDRHPAVAALSPRPTVVKALDRAPSLPPVVPDPYSAWLRDLATKGGDLTAETLLHVDPTTEVIEHLAPGPGSLTSLLAVGEGHIVAAEPTVDSDVAREVGAVIDDVLLGFEVALAGVMATVERWLQEESATDAARRQLDAWRIDTPTGEYPAVTTQAAYARALLVG